MHDRRRGDATITTRRTVGAIDREENERERSPGKKVYPKGKSAARNGRKKEMTFTPRPATRVTRRSRGAAIAVARELGSPLSKSLFYLGKLKVTLPRESRARDGLALHGSAIGLAARFHSTPVLTTADEAISRDLRVHRGTSSEAALQ